MIALNYVHFRQKLHLFCCFSICFFLFLINLLTNFVKTDAVIVNTNELIDSNEKLLLTRYSTLPILIILVLQPKLAYYSN